MIEVLAKSIEQMPHQELSDGGKFAETLKEDSSAGKDFSELVNADQIRAEDITARAYSFIQENAETPHEKEVANVLRELYENGKIKVVDTGAEIGFPVYGYYDPMNDCICLDIDAVLDYGTAEAIDTLAHEGYHAAQHHEGHINDVVEEETRAWNTGLEMSNKYRSENDETIVRIEPYTQNDILALGYPSDNGPFAGIFTELEGVEAA